MAEKPRIVFGIHTVCALLDRQPERCLHLYLQKDRTDQRLLALQKKATDQACKISWVNRDALDQLTEKGLHQGIALSCVAAKPYGEEDLFPLLEASSKKPFILILDGIQDPHNLGACLRSAEAAGVHAVIAPRDKSTGLTPTVYKVASGAAEIIPFIQVTNLARTLRTLREYPLWIFGAAGDAEKTLYQENFNTGIAIALGAEGQGLRRLTRDHCDALLSIPMLGNVASLNVSVATGIFLFEVVRQRGDN